MADFNVVKTGLSRVFLIEWRARGDRTPQYMNAMRAGAVSAGFGDTTAIKKPSDTRYGEYEEIDELSGAAERPTLSLEGRYARDLKSTLLKLARLRCPFDIQVHIGNCSDPRSFNEFEKAIILEGAKISTYNTDDLGALTDDDETEVNENVDLSAITIYEAMPLDFTEKAASLVTNEIVDVFIGDTKSCGGCDDPSGGCSRIFALTLAAGGSPSTPADIVYTPDQWANPYAHDIDSLGIAENPSAGDVLGLYVIVVSNDSASHHIALLSEFDGIQDPAFTEVTTGYVAGAEPNAIKAIGNIAFVVGDSGYVYKIDDPSDGVTVLDAGVAVSDNLYAVDALSDTFAVAVGWAGAVVMTSNGTSWSEVTNRPVGVGVTLNGVMVKSITEWWVVANDGTMYVTYNAGDSWTAKSFPGSGSGVAYDIALSTDSVFFMAHATTAPLGRILQTFDGGNSWIVLPQGSATLALNDRVNSIAPCTQDPNSVTGGGLADDASDGFLIYGVAAE
jgi:hypothetical protein